MQKKLLHKDDNTSVTTSMYEYITNNSSTRGIINHERLRVNTMFPYD